MQQRHAHGLVLDWGLAVQGDAVDVIKKSGRRPEQKSAGFKIAKAKTKIEKNKQMLLMKATKQHHFDMVIKKNLRKSGSGASSANKPKVVKHHESFFLQRGNANKSQSHHTDSILMEQSLTEIPSVQNHQQLPESGAARQNETPTTIHYIMN